MTASAGMVTVEAYQWDGSAEDALRVIRWAAERGIEVKAFDGNATIVDGRQTWTWLSPRSAGPLRPGQVLVVVLGQPIVVAAHRAEHIFTALTNPREKEHA